MSVLDAQETILRLGDGNPGAMSVLIRVFKELGENEFSSVAQGLRVLNFSGPEIWLCYKDYAGEDLQGFVEGIRSRNQRMQDIVNREMGR
jgi:hypothetical protein